MLARERGKGPTKHAADRPSTIKNVEGLRRLALNLSVQGGELDKALRDLQFATEEDGCLAGHFLNLQMRTAEVLGWLDILATDLDELTMLHPTGRSSLVELATMWRARHAGLPTHDRPLVALLALGSLFSIEEGVEPGPRRD